MGNESAVLELVVQGWSGGDRTKEPGGSDGGGGMGRGAGS